MAIIFIRTLIIFSVLVVVIRLMGKRQIGEMQPFEFIVTLIIADLACVPMADVSIPLVYGIVAVLTLFLMHQIFAILEKVTFFKKILSGVPSVVINKHGVNLNELKRNNLDVSDLIESMRAQGYFSLDQLDYAIFESNGKLSAFEKPNSEQCQSIPILLVNDGNLDKKNAEILKTEENTLKSFLLSKGYSIKNVEVMTVDVNGRTYIKGKKRNYEITSYPMPEGVKW